MTAPSLASLSLLAQIAGAPYIDRFATVLGSQMGPERVSSILAQRAQGYMWAAADLFEECRLRDPHLHGDLQRREMRVAGAEWELRPPENSGAVGKEVADFVTARLREIDAETDIGRSFTGVLADMQGAVYQGRSGHELLWSVEPRDGGGAWMLPRRAEFIHPRRFAYVTNWTLHLWDASGTNQDAVYPVNVDSPFGKYPGVSVREVNRVAPGKFLIHCPRVLGTYPTLEGLGGLLCWYAMFKRLGLREFLALVAWAGRGLRVGTFARGDGKMGANGATTDDGDMLRLALANLSAMTPAIVPDTATIDIKTVPGEGAMHERYLGLVNGEISKGVFGATLGSEVGKTGGNRALGEVHDKNEVKVAQNDARAVADSLRTGLFTPMVEYNFGKGAPVPTIVFDVSGGEDLRALAERMKLWTEMGGEVGAVSGANALAMPNLDPAEPRLGGKSAPASPPAPADPSTPATAPQAPTEPA